MHMYMAANIGHILLNRFINGLILGFARDV